MGFAEPSLTSSTTSGVFTITIETYNSNTTSPSTAYYNTHPFNRPSPPPTKLDRLIAEFRATAEAERGKQGFRMLESVVIETPKPKPSRHKTAPRTPEFVGAGPMCRRWR